MKGIFGRMKNGVMCLEYTQKPNKKLLRKNPKNKPPHRRVSDAHHGG